MPFHSRTMCSSEDTLPSSPMGILMPRHIHPPSPQRQADSLLGGWNSSPTLLMWRKVTRSPVILHPFGIVQECLAILTYCDGENDDKLWGVQAKTVEWMIGKLWDAIFQTEARGRWNNSQTGGRPESWGSGSYSPKFYRMYLPQVQQLQRILWDPSIWRLWNGDIISLNHPF